MFDSSFQCVPVGKWNGIAAAVSASSRQNFAGRSSANSSAAVLCSGEGEKMRMDLAQAELEN